ncbi:sesquipedalian-1-like [Cydia amplana]|uniref:sesquipedalian-1-like n=1 Tax=Cydia amplana TaxID=1869771 RepID=UPI002FE69DD1
MKINEKNLCAFASSATPVDREGWLDMREVGKSYTRRWFTLKGNLLFYFDKNGDKEPAGVIVLEGCTIELTEEEEAYSFKIVFQCAGGRTFYLCTNSQASMEAWMKALACASYDYMKLMVAELQRQLDEAEAEAAAEAAALVTTPTEEPRAPPRGQRYNPFNKLPENEPKAVPGSRHHKENLRPDMSRKKVPFRDIHTAFGRKILLDRSEWRATLAKRQKTVESPLIQL